LKYGTVSILFELLSFGKSSTALYKSWKKFLQNWACSISKEAEYCADFKNVQKSRVWQKGKKLLLKNWIFRDLENFAKNHFSEKKSLGTSWRKSSTHFWNQPKIPLLLIPCMPNFERKKISTLIRDGAVFSEVKSSNKIETDQYLKKCFFIN
jgi:hypothetical protein